jgi:iron complex outermembrane receptor protein
MAPSKTFTGRLEASYASFDDKTISGNVSGPIADWLRFSVSGYARHTDGYIKFSAKPANAGPTLSGDNAAPIKQQSVRAKLEADLTSDLTATLAYNFGYSDDPRGMLFTPRTHLSAIVPAVPLRATKRREMSYNRDSHNSVEVSEPTLKLVWKTGVGTLSSYSGYARRLSNQDNDPDGSYRDDTYGENRYREDSYQQTVDFAVDAIDRVDLVIGGNYFHDHTRSRPDEHIATYAPGKVLASTIFFDQKTEAYALYADANYHITDQLSVDVGGRYSHEDKTGFESSPAIGFAPTTKTASFKKFTPRASVRYEVAPRTNVYASYSQGFRSGTFPPIVGNPALMLPIKPEIVDAFEVGFKMARRGFRFDAAAFHYNDKDLHVSVIQTLCLNGPLSCGPSSRISNAPKAVVNGFEAQMDITPVDRLHLRAGGAYLHARYKNFPNAVGTGLDLETVLTPAFDVNVGGQIQDWSNQQMARAPTFSGNVGADYEVPLAGGGLVLAANLNYTDSFVVQNPSLFGPLAGAALAGKQRYRQEAYTLLNAQVTWTDKSDHFYVGIFGRNLTNTKYRFTYNSTTRGDYSTPAWPLQVGAKVGYKW